MTSLKFTFIAFIATLALSGCKSTPPPTKPGQTVVTPAPAPPIPAITGSEAQKQADEKLWRDVEAKKRKSKSAYLNKTKAYQNYIP